MEGNKLKTCEEQIDQELNGRLEEFLPDISTWTAEECKTHLEEAGFPAENQEIGELRLSVLEAIQNLAREEVLGCEEPITYRLCLTWGGPADYFELRWSKSAGVWSGGFYIYQEWFDGAVRPLSAEQTEELANVFGIFPEA